MKGFQTWRNFKPWWAHQRSPPVRQIPRHQRCRRRPTAPWQKTIEFGFALDMGREFFFCGEGFAINDHFYVQQTSTGRLVIYQDLAPTCHELLRVVNPQLGYYGMHF